MEVLIEMTENATYNYKRLLIISHNCMSKTGSNGRTLANLLLGWPKEKLAQFYIHAESPNFDVCNNYYCITDLSVGKSILKRTKAGYQVGELEKSDEKLGVDSLTTNTSSFSSHKNSLVFNLREIAWNSRLWNKDGLYNWIDNFLPQIVLVQAGDASFLLRIAEEVSEKYKIPLAIYNTEGYYFKSKSYLQDNKITSLFYPIVNHRFVKAYDSLVMRSKAIIYNNPLLQESYDSIYHKKSHLVMGNSELTDENVYTPKKRGIIYAGNLGLNRYKSLIEFANALQSIDKTLHVDVFGKVPDIRAEKELIECNNIILHGFISYEELKQRLRESQYLLHIESFDEFYKEDLKYAFSTKIADSLASGACFIVYAPTNMAITQYLMNTGAAVVITERDKLVDELKKIFLNQSIAERIAKKGRDLAMKNHNLKSNQHEFQSILLDLEV